MVKIAKPRLSIFTNPQSLGTVFKEQNQITIPMSGKSLPLTGTSGNYKVNAFGKYRTILVQGAHDGTSFTGADVDTRLYNLIETFEAWINAGVQTDQIYYDSMGHQYPVMCLDFTWTRSITDPNRILYSLMMMEVAPAW